RADDGRDGDECVFQSMPNDHGALLQPLTPRGPDVLLAEGLEHARPGNPGEEATGAESKYEYGHDHVLPASPAYEGEQMEVHPEDVDEENGEDESGDRRPDRRDEHAQVIDHGVLLQRADDPERDRKGEREDEGADAELERRPDALPDDVDDRCPSGKADAEVAAQDVSHVRDELDGDRLIDTVKAADPVDRLLGHRAVGVFVEGISGRKVGKAEGDEGDEEHRRDD